MASTMNMATAHLDEGVLKGARRSRFSLHFNWLRRRRWLLVQWVSIPVESGDPSSNAALERAARRQAARPLRLAGVLDEYSTAHVMKHMI